MSESYGEAITDIRITINDLTVDERAELAVVAADEGYDPGDYVLRRWTSDGRAFTCTDSDTAILTIGDQPKRTGFTVRGGPYS